MKLGESQGKKIDRQTQVLRKAEHIRGGINIQRECERGCLRSSFEGACELRQMHPLG